MYEDSLLLFEVVGDELDGAFEVEVDGFVADIFDIDSVIDEVLHL